MFSRTRPCGWLWAGIVATSLLSGCASTLVVAPSDYLPPATETAIVPSRELFGNPEATLKSAAGQLESRGFRAEFSQRAGVLVATYSGNLDDMVDCGELIVPGETEARLASQAQMSISAFPDRDAWKALRQMRLDARSITQTRPGSNGFRARTEVVYVVTRTIDTISSTGAVLGTDREIISFESGAEGRFGNGLICQPTGVLENQIGTVVADAASLGGGIDGLTPIDEALPLDQSVDQAITTTEINEVPLLPPTLPTPSLPTDIPVATGSTCGSLAPADAALIAPGGCSVQRFVDEIGQAAYPGFDIAVAGGDDGLAIGSPLTLEVTLPGGNRYFHVAYLATDGLIYHAGPKFIDQQGVGERFLYQTNFDLLANDRIELILAMSSPTEIFAFQRPNNEPALDFLAIMNERFANNSNDLAMIAVQRGLHP